jgi:predicted phosphoribosyltransferase
MALGPEDEGEEPPKGADMQYAHRLEAGTILAQQLASSPPLGPAVVAGIPRGGVAVAAPIADRLALPLTVIHAGKLAAPSSPDAPFGAIDEDGRTLLDHKAIVALGITADQIGQARAKAASEVAWQRSVYPHTRQRDLLLGRIVLIVDDGMATGLTLQAAIHYAQRHGCRACVVAVPCASASAAVGIEGSLRRPGDRLVCPIADPDFQGVAAYYRDHFPVSDEEVSLILTRAGHRPAKDGKETRG